MNVPSSDGHASSLLRKLHGFDESTRVHDDSEEKRSKCSLSIQGYHRTSIILKRLLNDLPSDISKLNPQGINNSMYPSVTLVSFFLKLILLMCMVI
jgi:hypothetical protein